MERSLSCMFYLFTIAPECSCLFEYVSVSECYQLQFMMLMLLPLLFPFVKKRHSLLKEARREIIGILPKLTKSISIISKFRSNLHVFMKI